MQMSIVYMEKKLSHFLCLHMLCHGLNFPICMYNMSITFHQIINLVLFYFYRLIDFYITLLFTDLGPTLTYILPT